GPHLLVELAAEVAGEVPVVVLVPQHHPVEAGRRHRLGGADDAGADLGDDLAHRTWTTRSSSTGALPGRWATPMAVRAWRPRSASTSTNSCDAPSVTADCCTKPSALATKPVTLRICWTFWRTTSCSSDDSALMAAMRAAATP